MIVLSVFLGVFLLVGIIAGLLIIKILKKAKHVGEQAEFVAQNVSQLTSSFSRFTNGAVVLAALGRMADKVRKKK